MQSVEEEQVVVVIVLTGDGLAMTICLPGVTGCLFIGRKWVNSVSIELMLSLLLLLLLLLATQSALCSGAGLEGGRWWVVGGGWNREEGEKLNISDELFRGLNTEERKLLA